MDQFRGTSSSSDSEAVFILIFEVEFRELFSDISISSLILGIYIFSPSDKI